MTKSPDDTKFLAPFRARSRLRLRARITIAFAIGALLLSAILVATTYTLVRQNLLRERESAAVNQAYTNARTLANRLNTQGIDVQQVINTALQLPKGSQALAVFGSKSAASSLSISEKDLPSLLRNTLQQGKPATQRFVAHGKMYLAIGVPLSSVNATYFEIESLTELEDTLRSISVALLGAAALTTIAGIVLGVWAGRGTLRPLKAVGDAAESIASGNLNTRLVTVGDKDIARLTSSFNDMAAALQNRVERDARFASDVSHELRSPLMTLSASISVLEGRRDELSEKASQALDLLVGDVERFKNLVEDLLEISRFDAGAVRLQLDDVIISELVGYAARTNGAVAVPVIVGEGVEEVIVRADKRRLVRALSNLIDNARKYGGGATDITIALEKSSVSISVNDSGPGVPDDDKEIIFERFNRGVNSNRRGGTRGDGVGLGLALVNEHVRLHGGRVWVQDRPDGRPGASFVVELPAMSARAARRFRDSEDHEDLSDVPT